MISSPLIRGNIDIIKVSKYLLERLADIVRRNIYVRDRDGIWRNIIEPNDCYTDTVIDLIVALLGNGGRPPTL